MAGPLIVVDSHPKGKVLLDYFAQQAEVVTVQSPPLSCSYTEKKDEVGISHLRFFFSPITTHSQFIEAVNIDPDREILLAFENDVTGDYLSWLIQGYLHAQRGGLEKVKRLQVPHLSKGGIQKALEKSLPGDLEEKQEFYVRSLFDSGLGVHLQRLIGSRVGPGDRPLTYASLTLIFLLADRETEIKMFASRKRWQILVELGVDEKKFKARLEKAGDITKDGWIKDVDQGKELVPRIKESPFVIDEIEKGELVLGAPSPYVLVELLDDAQVLYGLQPGKTGEILKNLCSGVELQGKWQALVSSTAASEEDCADLLATLEKTAADLFGEENRGEVSAEGGPGVLLPLDPDVNRDVLGETLDEDSLKVYELIRGRALASQMLDAVGESIRVQLSSGDIVFHAHFNSIIQQGFLLAHQGRNDDDLMEPCPFVDLQEGQQLECLDIVPEQGVGIPAEHYTYETLFAELADFSVAPEPHNVMMLQGLIDHGYIIVSPDGSLVADSNTIKVAKLINRAFPKMSGVNFSAYIEQTVNEVLSGRKGLDFALKQFGQTLMIQGKNLVKVKLPQKIALKKRSSSTIIKQAPKVEAPAVGKISEPKPGEIKKGQEELSEAEPIERQQDETLAPSGQDDDGQEAVSQVNEELEAPGGDLFEDEQVAEVENGEVGLVGAQDLETDIVADEEGGVEAFLKGEKDALGVEDKKLLDGVDGLADTAVADARQTESLDSSEELVETDQSKACQVCGKPMILKKDQFGRFWNCSGFPSCRHSESFSSKQESSMLCPLCKESEVVTKRTPTGKTFYVCLEPDCEFMAWSKPHQLSCQVCESPYLVEKKSAKGKKHLRCPRAGCNYMQAMPGEDGKDLLDEKPAAAEPVRKKVRVVRRVKGTSGSGGTKKVRVVRRRK